MNQNVEPGTLLIVADNLPCYVLSSMSLLYLHSLQHFFIMQCSDDLFVLYLSRNPEDAVHTVLRIYEMQK